MATAEALTTAQVALRLGVTRTMVLKHVKDGRLKHTAKLPGANGAYLFTEKAVEKLERDLKERAAAS